MTSCRRIATSLLIDLFEFDEYLKTKYVGPLPAKLRSQKISTEIIVVFMYFIVVFMYFIVVSMYFK
jgi:hypothetical protein